MGGWECVPLRVVWLTLDFSPMFSGRRNWVVMASRESPWYERQAWAWVFVLAVLVALFGVFVLFSPVDSADFENETGIVWGEFTDDAPSVADYLRREARLLGAVTFGFGLFAAGLAFAARRGSDRTVLSLLWIFPAVLGVTAVVFFASDAAGLGGFYLVAAILAAAAVALSARNYQA